jgi:hypothetical protein
MLRESGIPLSARLVAKIEYLHRPEAVARLDDWKEGQR